MSRSVARALSLTETEAFATGTEVVVTEGPEKTGR